MILENVLSVILICALVLLITLIISVAYFYRRTMIRQNAKMEQTVKMAGTDWSQYKDLLAKRKEFMLSQKREEVYVTSSDNLKLHGVFFPAINAVENKKKRVVICLHGYTSRSMQDFTGLTDYYFKHGFAMLQVDLRAHGESEGKYIGFGCQDRKDVLIWIDWILANVGKDAEIYLHGISMGASTALMSCGLDLPLQVKGVVSDCAFTSPKEVFSHVLNTMYHLPAFPLIQAADVVNRLLAGYGTDECNAKREVAKSHMPILFIHGEKDTFVPVSMCHELYQCANEPKSKLIIEGAAHGESYYKDTASYEAALDEFYKE